MTGTGQADRDDPLETLVADCLRGHEEGDPGMLERLCARHPEHAAALRARVRAVAAAGLLGAAPDNQPVVSGFAVTGRIGQGGMGEVWRAEQQGPLRRPVALKIIRRSYSGSGQVLARFESERQALALMSHPGIAQVYAAGTTADGAPFFAMELIDGAPITQYCEARRLPVRARVELFREVCRAVHHAHQRGVLHRDLKPGNILVAEAAGRPQPKVIDFGLAKALAEPLADRSMVTEVGQILGTPEYMSPEQAKLTELGVDTRTDVYALGVVLYELLTGVLPLGSPLLRERGITELLRVIREVAPPRASARIAALGEGAAELAAARGTDAGRLQRTLRGDLDWILDCALAKDRERRYSTALDFERDLEHWLGGLPVRAGPPSTVYRVRKFVRRHRALVAATATVLGVLVAALAVSTTFFVQRERSLLDFDRLALVEQAERHNAIARDELWPMHPDRVPAFAEWLAAAERMLGQRAAIAATLTAVRARAANPDLDRLEERYDQFRDVILDRSLARLASALEQMDEWATDVRCRRDWAASLRRRSIEDHAAAWATATAAIRDRAQCPLYDGLELAPQLGLVPLGCNEQGLWEFALLHPRLVLPQRDPRPGRANAWQIEPDTALVFVLLPGGKYVMGAQRRRPAWLNYDPQALGNEATAQGSPYRLLLAPFFLSKYEVSQGQWSCAGDDRNPSLWTEAYARDPDRKVPHSLGPTHPVEQIGWAEAMAMARRLGLVLPTEAQWEFGARGATSSPWWTGREVACLAGAANLRDATCRRHEYLWDWEDLDDGWMLTAPVGSFRPNPFGLHDVVGNVAEWVREPPVDYGLAPRAGDGERPHDETRPERLARGGTFESRAAQARVSFRLTVAAGPNATVGVRFARSLDEPPATK